jgi:hypothetical protein
MSLYTMQTENGPGKKHFFFKLELPIGYHHCCRHCYHRGVTCCHFCHHCHYYHHCHYSHITVTVKFSAKHPTLPLIGKSAKTGWNFPLKWKRAHAKNLEKWNDKTLCISRRWCCQGCSFLTAANVTNQFSCGRSETDRVVTNRGDKQHKAVAEKQSSGTKRRFHSLFKAAIWCLWGTSNG